MIVFEVFSEHVTTNNGSNVESIFQSSGGILLPNSLLNAERFVSGLQEYILKHGHNSDEECTLCFPCQVILLHSHWSDVNVLQFDLFYILFHKLMLQ